MNEKNDLTQGSVGKNLVLFALPYLLSSFMQTFYGMADLFVVGLYNGSETTTAVAIGSQVMHMLTVIIIGFVMGTTVRIGQCVGARDEKAAAKTVGTSAVFFSVFAVVVTAGLLLGTVPIVRVMLTPQEAVAQTRLYLLICFAGVPLIVAYNVISGIFRGAGDSRKPMYFVAAACVTNIVLDFVFIGFCGMGAAGAALGTVCGQAVSVAAAFLVIRRQNPGFSVSRQDFCMDREVVGRILKVGTPVAMQDGLIQVAFVVITVIANSRGLIVSAAVGIVEKLIGFPRSCRPSLPSRPRIWERTRRSGPEGACTTVWRLRWDGGFAVPCTVSFCRIHWWVFLRGMTPCWQRGALICSPMRLTVYLRRCISVSAGISAVTRNPWSHLSTISQPSCWCVSREPGWPAGCSRHLSTRWAGRRLWDHCCRR